MTMRLLIDLKRELESWKQSVKIREETYRTLIKQEEKLKKEYALAKRLRNREYLKWKEARAKVKTLNTAVKSFPYIVRANTKNNPGQALNKMLGEI